MRTSESNFLKDSVVVPAQNGAVFIREYILKEKYIGTQPPVFATFAAMEHGIQFKLCSTRIVDSGETELIWHLLKETAAIKKIGEGVFANNAFHITHASPESQREGSATTDDPHLSVTASVTAMRVISAAAPPLPFHNEVDPETVRALAETPEMKAYVDWFACLQIAQAVLPVKTVLLLPGNAFPVPQVNVAAPQKIIRRSVSPSSRSGAMAAPLPLIRHF